MSENEAIYHNFYQWKIASSGRIQKITVDMFVDSTDRPAGQLKDEHVKLLCKVEADVSHIPESQLTKRKGSDGELYYDLECKLEAVCKCIFPFSSILRSRCTKRRLDYCLTRNGRPLCVHLLDPHSQGPAVQHSDRRIRLNNYQKHEELHQ